ncbi:hypothetical protein BDN70DRAFT_891775 [Pholiota conissans]|uniref:Uncharacterized protein n=1 Tax=Pholiota conissans TaxID=109636 RepID=A0A9P6CXU8_9AGAR|nr:hypothetical protein BDN70DRAFT_891775 [Pholiota conissans]
MFSTVSQSRSAFSLGSFDNHNSFYTGMPVLEEELGLINEYVPPLPKDPVKMYREYDPRRIDSRKLRTIKMEDLDNGSGRIQGGPEILKAYSTRMYKDVKGRNTDFNRLNTARRLGISKDDPHSIARALNSSSNSEVDDSPEASYIDACHPLCTGKVALRTLPKIPASEQLTDQYIDPALLDPEGGWGTQYIPDGTEAMPLGSVYILPNFIFPTPPTPHQEQSTYSFPPTKKVATRRARKHKVVKKATAIRLPLKLKERRRGSKSLVKVTLRRRDSLKSLLAIH